jgi:hypothetical protein
VSLWRKKFDDSDALQYRDPLIGVLDYIVEVRPPEHDRSRIMYSAGPKKKCIEDGVDEDTIAVAHDDELQLIEDVVSSSQNQFSSEVNK